MFACSCFLHLLLSSTLHFLQLICKVSEKMPSVQKKHNVSDFLHMSRGCIICLWSSTWAGPSKTRWSTWGCRTPAMKPSTRSDTSLQEIEATTHTMHMLNMICIMTALVFITFCFFIKMSTVGFHVLFCCSSAWTWRSWRRWRRMQVWGTEVWADWQVKCCRCVGDRKKKRKRFIISFKHFKVIGEMEKTDKKTSYYF